MASARGGRRQGAGRPSGDAWKPRLTQMREQTVKQLNRIVAAEQNPLSVLVNFACDEDLDVNTRMNAAAIALPYLFPKLSEMRIDSKTTITSVDGTALMERIAEKIEKLASCTPPRMVELIEAEPAGDDQDRAGGKVAAGGHLGDPA